jgi:hypothetical protein
MVKNVNDVDARGRVARRNKWGESSHGAEAFGRLYSFDGPFSFILNDAETDNFWREVMASRD